MANQRSTEKKALHVWIPAVLHDQLRALAAAHGVSLSVYVTAALKSICNKTHPTKP